MNKKKQQTEQTKQRVADSARGIFAQKGYAATTIEDLVNVTGCSKGNLYYHFKSKEGLFLYLLDEWDREWEEEWRKKEHQYDTVADKLYGLAEHLVRDELNHPLLKAADEFFGNGRDNNFIMERIARMIKEHIEFNRKLLQQGMDSGEFKHDDAEMLGTVLESLINGLSGMSRTRSLEDALKLYRKSITVFLYGVASQPR